MILPLVLYALVCQSSFAAARYEDEDLPRSSWRTVFGSRCRTSADCQVYESEFQTCQERRCTCNENMIPVVVKYRVTCQSSDLCSSPPMWDKVPSIEGSPVEGDIPTKLLISPTSGLMRGVDDKKKWFGLRQFAQLPAEQSIMNEKENMEEDASVPIVAGLFRGVEDEGKWLESLQSEEEPGSQLGKSTDSMDQESSSLAVAAGLFRGVENEDKWLGTKDSPQEQPDTLYLSDARKPYGESNTRIVFTPPQGHQADMKIRPPKTYGTRSHLQMRNYNKKIARPRGVKLMSRYNAGYRVPEYGQRHKKS